MTQGAVMERIIGLLRWVWCFFYVQLLFVAGTLAGGVVAGFFPALYATVHTAREMMGPGQSMFETRRFIALYRAGFWRSQVVGYLGLLGGAICLSNVVFFHQLTANHPAARVIVVCWLVASVIGSTVWVLVMPTAIDFKVPLRQIARLARAGCGDLRNLLGLAGGTAVLVTGLVVQTGLFLPIALGAFIFLLAAANESFEQRQQRKEPADGHPLG